MRGEKLELAMVGFTASVLVVVAVVLILLGGRVPLLQRVSPREAELHPAPIRVECREPAPAPGDGAGP